MNRLVVEVQPEKLFLYYASIFGFIFLLLSAPFQAPDEHVHFYRAYQISTGHLTDAKAVLPDSVLDFSRTVSKDLPGNDQNRQSKKALVYEFFRSFTEQPQSEISMATTAIYSPLPYLPQAFGVWLGRSAHLNPIFIFYLGRLFNLLAWTGLTFLAIRATPIHPRLFVALALMPMTLHQAASNSPDALTNAISFLFIAFALRMIFDPRPSLRTKDWAIIALLAIALGLCKSIYILVAGLLIIVLFRRFRLQRAVLPLVLAVLSLGLLSGLGWLELSSRSVSVQTMDELKTPTTSGLTYVLQHPLIAAPILWRTATTYTGFQIRMFIGILGWFDTVLPNWVYPLYCGLLFFIAFLEPHPQFFFTLLERLWIVALVLVAGVMMMVAFFYPEISVGNGILGVIQGRYYIPFGPLYFLPFSQRKWFLPKDSPAWLAVAVLHGLVLIVSIRAMLWRYYNI